MEYLAFVQVTESVHRLSEEYRNTIRIAFYILINSLSRNILHNYVSSMQLLVNIVVEYSHNVLVIYMMH